MKPKPVDDEAHVMGDKGSIMKFMLSRVCQKTMFLMFIQNSKKKQSKKRNSTLSVRDADIDNDGDTDSSDEYLHKRRHIKKQ